MSAISSKNSATLAAAENFAVVPYRGTPEAILRDSLTWAPSKRSLILDRCYYLIQKNNRLKSANTPAAIVLQAAFDDTGAITNYRLIPRLEELVKTHYVALQVIGEQKEKLGDVVRKVAKELSGRAIVALIVNAHGDSDSIQLGDDNFYTINDVTADDFTSLDVKASIIFASCYTGQNLAKKIAAVQSRVVFATTEALFESVFFPCCTEHGLGIIGFDDSEPLNMVVKKYQLQGSNVTEVAPCSVTVAEIEKIKKELLEQAIKAAALGDADGQYDLALAYFHGQGLKKSPQKAMQWLLKAANLGHRLAQNVLGIVYEGGEGIEKSIAQAVFWYWKAAVQGCVSAQDRLAVLYWDETLDLYSYKNLDPEFDSLKAAVIKVREDAEQGSATSQYNLGYCYEVGDCLEQSDTNAATWYSLAAAQGHQEAQHRLLILQLKALKL